MKVVSLKKLIFAQVVGTIRLNLAHIPSVLAYGATCPYMGTRFRAITQQFLVQFQKETCPDKQETNSYKNNTLSKIVQY